MAKSAKPANSGINTDFLSTTSVIEVEIRLMWSIRMYGDRQRMWVSWTNCSKRDEEDDDNDWKYWFMTDVDLLDINNGDQPFLYM